MGFTLRAASPVCTRGHPFHYRVWSTPRSTPSFSLPATHHLVIASQPLRLQPLTSSASSCRDRASAFYIYKKKKKKKKEEKAGVNPSVDACTCHLLASVCLCTKMESTVTNAARLWMFRELAERTVYQGKEYPVMVALFSRIRREKYTVTATKWNGNVWKGILKEFLKRNVY